MPRDLATRLYFAAIHLIRKLRAEDDKIGLSPAQLSAISTLVSRGEMTLSEFAEAHGVRPPTITRLVQRLEADGYVIREGSPSDRRVATVRHTSKAWTMLERGASKRAAALSEAMRALSAEETDTLEHAVEIMERIGRERIEPR